MYSRLIQLQCSTAIPPENTVSFTIVTIIKVCVYLVISTHIGQPNSHKLIMWKKKTQICKHNRTTIILPIQMLVNYPNNNSPYRLLNSQPQSHNNHLSTIKSKSNKTKKQKNLCSYVWSPSHFSMLTAVSPAWCVCVCVWRQGPRSHSV